MKLPGRLRSKSTHTTFYRSRRGESPPRSCHPRPTVYRHASVLAHSHAVVYSYLEVKTKKLPFINAYRQISGYFFIAWEQTWGQKFKNSLSDSHFMSKKYDTLLAVSEEGKMQHSLLSSSSLPARLHFSHCKAFYLGLHIQTDTAYCHAIYLQEKVEESTKHTLHSCICQ